MRGTLQKGAANALINLGFDRDPGILYWQCLSPYKPDFVTKIIFIILI
jgi:hypothetical protein